MSFFEFAMWAGALLLVISGVSYPAYRRLKKTGKRPAGGAAGAFAVIDEIFHPSARETRIVMEEQAEARAPTPSAADKPFENNCITISIPRSTK